MQSAFELPINRPDPTRTHRHVRTRHYAYLVQESLTSRFAKCVCSILVSLLLVIGIIFFLLFLSLRPHRPRFYLGSFSLPQPDSPITFNVSDHNTNQKIGIYYDSMSGSVYYKNSVIASGQIMSPFYQPAKTTTPIQGQLALTSAGNVSSQLSADEGMGRVALRFEIRSTIRFKVNMWDSHQHNLHVSCDMVLGSDGNLLPGYVNERCPIYF